MNYRIERDTMGEVHVPADKYWGAQTQRSYQNFRIGTDRMPAEILKAFAVLKKAAAAVNVHLGKLTAEQGAVITQVCDEILLGQLDDQFPLMIYQTGSGTQTNMNFNEVIANRGNVLAGKQLLHPNDHVNCSQSSNDTFPTAMHIAALIALEDRLLPAIAQLTETLLRLEAENRDLVKTGRTHLQDATPLTLGQEISGWRSMMDHSAQMVRLTLDPLRELALGGTAVGTGLNAPQGFGEATAEEISRLTGKKFITAPNKFHSLSSRDALVFCHGTLKALAGDLMKMANDIRWLASGPRCGLGELRIPENEPGSSIMPGKVNPTQCEALTMVCVQVMGNDTSIGFAASQGNFQLNVFMPVLIHNFMESVGLLSDAIYSFDKNCLQGLQPNRERIKENLNRSLMLVTALNPYIGYENAAQIAKLAYRDAISLKAAAAQLGILQPDEFDKLVNPKRMV